MRPLRSTRPPLRRTVFLSMVLLSLCLPPAADALHCHRKHRRHHRHGQHATDGGHISQPPALLPPEAEVGGDSPAFPPDLEDHAPAPSPSYRHDKPCNPPPSRAPVGVPTRSPVAPAKPSFPPAKPPSPSPSPAKAPSHSHSRPPSIYLAKPPALPPAEPPTLAGAKPPSVSPARPPLPPTRAPPSSFSPSKPPSASFSQPKQPPCTPAKPPQAEPPRPSPAAAKPPTMPSPSQPPQLSPANPPLHPPPPAMPPTAAPVQTPLPLLTPAKPPAHAPAPKPPTHPAIPPVAAKPPAVPPAMTKAKPPPPSLPPAAPAAKKNTSAASINVFDVSAFGALGNGSSEDTRAFRAAWKAACSAESATLLVPSDGVFTITSTIFAGPCKHGLTFQIDGVLMPPDGPASWPEPDSRRQWLVFYRADGMTLTGRGTIEGNGEEWWNLPCKPHRGPNGSTLPGPCDSPALIRFLASSNVTVEGPRMENSPQFHLKFDGCERVLVDGLVVSSPAFSPNTDGIHVENTTSVQIFNSRISNGDDCVSIGAGCSHVHIENVTCGHGHGISIGSLGVHNTRACVSNVTVRNARIVDSDNGVRIKTWQGGAGSVSAVEFAGVRMDNVRNCIVIDQYYCLGRACANQTAAVRVAGVAYRDIRGTYSAQAGAPVRFACSDSVACTGITMAEVELRPARGDGGGAVARLADPYCWNAYGVVETLTLPPVYCLQDGRPDFLQDQLTSC